MEVIKSLEGAHAKPKYISAKAGNWRTAVSLDKWSNMRPDLSSQWPLVLLGLCCKLAPLLTFALFLSGAPSTFFDNAGPRGYGGRAPLSPPREEFLNLLAQAPLSAVRADLPMAFK